ncbi:MAG: hypothetical protein ABIS50_20615 [Luteolibacter sp.]|uniref:hypothetical protein n=1 Tax=Luteolibacter sp. TaxID=1962973 RepID=UPI003264D6B2
MAEFPGLHPGDFPAKVSPEEMDAAATSGTRGDGRLWAIALGLSLVANVAILGLAGFAAIKTRSLRKDPPPPAAAAAETIMTIFPELPATSAEKAVAAPPPPEETAKQRFARTSDDQSAPPPESAAFIGERNTQGTSDRAPDATAPPLPSQAGIEPRNEDDLETTESTYRDGKLASESARTTPPAANSDPAPAMPPSDPAVANQAPAGEKVPNPGNDETTSTPPVAEKLLDGPNPVDVSVPEETAATNEIKPTPPKNKKDGGSPTKAADLPKPPAPKPINDPAFAGYQRKAAIVGSISRTGRSALNVADTPLGRYQAEISRAVELEWQRNCVRHRDFITPGYLTVRFYVETSGKVRTVQFVGQMETGEVQKGFTLNSIRDAAIPPMPASLKQEFSKQPLELVFNFLF